MRDCLLITKHSRISIIHHCWIYDQLLKDYIHCWNKKLIGKKQMIKSVHCLLYYVTVRDFYVFSHNISLHGTCTLSITILHCMGLAPYHSQYFTAWYLHVISHNISLYRIPFTLSVIILHSMRLARCQSEYFTVRDLHVVCHNTSLYGTCSHNISPSWDVQNSCAYLQWE